MDPRLVLLDRHVAQAADAWLADPRDAGVYGRLITAIEARRQHLNPTLDEAASNSEPDAGRRDDDERVADNEATSAVDVRAVGADLGGSPETVLERLRRGTG